jgi:acyl-CoA reductase-like NAD-dependent aldehyde dehydrogenase
MVAFTGSVPTGQRVMAAAVPGVKRLLLELGSSDPFIVLGDAKLDVAADGARFAAFLNAGQVCVSAERFYVEDAIFEPFMERFVELTDELRIGDPMGEVDIGALVSRQIHQGADRAVHELLERGGRLVRGGGRPAGLDRGHFYEPTLVEVDDSGTQALRREVFGPVATVTRVRDLDHALDLANDSPFGLGASIYTSSLETAMRAATELRSGMVWINDPLKDNDAAPFGGMKMSGLGRELGPEGISAFTEIKHVHIDFAQQPSPEWWFPYPAQAPAGSTADEALSGSQG